MITNCLKCDICRGRKNIVNASGDFTNCKIMFIGEAPGANEDKTGLPFVGKAGKLLDTMINYYGMYRDKGIVITNVIKCRPPGNRTPMLNEINNCLPYLEDEIKTYNPKVIVLLGTTAMKIVIGNSDIISKRRGTYLIYDNRIFFFTYHPSYILKNIDNDKIIRQYSNDFNFISKLYNYMK